MRWSNICIHKFYMHDGIIPMALSTETPYNACVFIEDINRGAKYV